MVQPLARESGLAVNEHNQILVDPFLHSVSHQEIYAIGEAAMPVENPGVPHVRMSAFTASIMAAHGADYLSAILTGKTPKPLSFAYVAQAVALGQNNAIFLPLSPDDRPRPPYITGWLGAFLVCFRGWERDVMSNSFKSELLKDTLRNTCITSPERGENCTFHRESSVSPLTRGGRGRGSFPGCRE